MASYFSITNGNSTSSSKGRVAIQIVTSLSLGWLAYSYYYQVRKQQQQRRRQNKVVAKTEHGKDTEEPGLTESEQRETERQFGASLSLVKSELLRSLSPMEQLILYGLYKQVTSGDVDGNDKPPVWNVTESAKHEARTKCRGMSKHTAMLHYLYAVRKFQEQTARTPDRLHALENADIVYSDDDGESDDDDDFDGVTPQASLKTYQPDPGTPPSGFGLRPSVLVYDDEPSDDDDAASSVLHRAARAGDPALVRAALAAGPASLLEARDESGQTALHFCADRGHVESLHCLLEAGADVNAQDQDRMTVLQTAVMADRVEIVRHLLRQEGIDVRAQDSDGDTPLSCATEFGSDEMQGLFEGL